MNRQVGKGKQQNKLRETGSQNAGRLRQSTGTQEDDFRSRLEETERLKQLRRRKEKELQRRKRNRMLLLGMIAAACLLLLVLGVYFGGKAILAFVSGNKETREPVSEERSEPAFTEEETEASTPEPTTEPTTPEPATKAPDPREDVWEHYSNMFVASKTGNYLNVRNQPTTDGTIIGKLVKYAGGELLEDLGNGWFHIRSGGIDGFVSSEYCVTGEEARRVALEHCFEMVEVTAERLNVRSGPGEEYEVWTQLSAAEKQVVEETDGDWLKISFNSTYGYINKAFTKVGYYLVEAVPWTSISNYSATRQALFAYAEQFIGTPYVYGGNDLRGGIDCSAYVQQCFANAIGIRLPRTSREQAASGMGVPVTLAEAKPGDLLFYADASGTIDHVAMYMGDGKILHAAQSLKQVIVSKYNYSTEPVKILNIIGE